MAKEVNQEVMGHVQALGNLSGDLRAWKEKLIHKRNLRPSEKAMALADINRKLEALDKATAALIAREG